MNVKRETAVESMIKNICAHLWLINPFFLLILNKRLKPIVLGKTKFVIHFSGGDVTVFRTLPELTGI